MAENQNNTMVQEAPLTDDLFERIGTEGLSVMILLVLCWVIIFSMVQD